MSAKTKLLLIIISIIFCRTEQADGQSIYGWRGVGRSGIYKETSLMKSWPDKGPALMWESLEAGTGPYWAHPVINKGRLFIRHGEYLAVYSIKSK
jgi:hypothetical protein